MSVDLDRLEQLARTAPDGEWYVEEEPDERGRTVVHMPPGEAKYIAATDRKTVLELVQRLRAAEEAVCTATTMNIRDMKTVSEYNALYHRANDRTRLLEGIVRDRAACSDHAANCCADWCEHCKTGVNWERRAEEATKP